MNTDDVITVIRARRSKRLAKLIRTDGTIADYDNAFRFDLIERPVASLDAAGTLLRQPTRRPDCAIEREAAAAEQEGRTSAADRLAWRVAALREATR